MIGMKKKLHWFCFTYHGEDLNGRQCTACTYTGYPRKNVTREMIQENKRNAEVKPESVLVAIIYLGRMTRDEFKGVRHEQG